MTAPPGPTGPIQTVDSDRFLFLGDLALPRPSKEYEEFALRCEKDLRVLNFRDMKEIPNPPITNLDDAFERFRTKEVQTWKSVLQQDRSPEFLVRPSGSLDSLIAHHLNQPSFTTRYPENSETADATNNCISMVMGNLYDAGTLLFDHVSRREDQSEAIEAYDAEVLACHEALQDEISHSMKAKVELVWGDKVRKRLLELYRGHIDVLPLWGEFQGVIALLLREDYFRNADPRFRFRRLILTPYHPNFMFYQRVQSPETILQDKIMKAAALMVGTNRLHWIPDYYARKRWFWRTPPPSRGVSSEACLPKSADSSRDEAQLQIATKGALDSFFTKYPHSNNQLRELIPPAMAAVHSCDSSVKWQGFPDLPEAIRTWLEGQKEILFTGTTVSSFDDIIKALKGAQRPQLLSAKSVQDEFLNIMKIQQHALENIDEMYQDAWHSRFTGETMELKCMECGAKLKPDLAPRWAVYRPGHFVTRRRRCKGCRGKVRKAIPANEGIPFIARDPEMIQLPPQAKPQIFSIAQYTWTHPNNENNDNYPVTVRTYCNKCKELTRLEDGSSFYIDTNPRWTIANPSLYVAPERPCLRCHELRKGRGAARTTVFVPIDQSIEFTLWGTLKSFHLTYGALEIDIKLLLLRDARPSSR